jgi:hypothetical protein
MAYDLGKGKVTIYEAEKINNFLDFQISFLEGQASRLAEGGYNPVPAGEGTAIEANTAPSSEALAAMNKIMEQIDELTEQKIKLGRALSAAKATIAFDLGEAAA